MKYYFKYKALLKKYIYLKSLIDYDFWEVSDFE